MSSPTTVDMMLMTIKYVKHLVDKQISDQSRPLSLKNNILIGHIVTSSLLIGYIMFDSNHYSDLLTNLSCRNSNTCVLKMSFLPPVCTWYYRLNWAKKIPEDSEMNEMAPPSRHRIRNWSPGGLIPSTIYLSVTEAPTILSLHAWVTVDCS